MFSLKQLVAFVALAGSLFAHQKPHVLLILVDDMGYGDPGCFNSQSKIPTPYINQLANAGIKFTDAHAPGPLCHLSRYGLMTGRYPFRKEIKWRNHTAIDEGRLTLPQMLQRNGYRTEMVGKWHLGFIEDPGFEKTLRGGPLDRGFDRFFGIRASTDIAPYFYIRDRHAVMPPSEKIEANRSEGWSPIQGKFWRAGGIAPDLKLEEVTPRFTAQAVSVIEQHGRQASDQPLMLYLAYPGPHTPWLPTDEYVGKTSLGLYGDFTHQIDAEIGKVLKALKKAKMAENTLVIFTSDNGPVWYPEDTKRLSHDSAGGLRGMKADAWEGGHRMPFIMRWPSRIQPGRVSDHPICFTDLFATLAEINQVELSQGEAPDSVSFLGVLDGQRIQEREAIVMGAGRDHFLIRKGPWKLIIGRESGGFSRVDRELLKNLPPYQLYDLAQDRGETNNLVEKYPEKVTELHDLFLRIRAQK